MPFTRIPPQRRFGILDGAVRMVRGLGRRRRLRVLARRVSLIGSGLALMVLGVAFAPSPLPVGFVLFAVGLYLVARGSRWARRLIKIGRRMVPPFSRGLNRVKHRLPRPMKTFIEQSDPGE